MSDEPGGGAAANTVGGGAAANTVGGGAAANTVGGGAAANTVGDGSAGGGGNGAGRGSPAVVGLSSLVTKDLTGVSGIDEKREIARQIIAIMIVGTIFVIVIFSFISLWMGSKGFANLKGLLEILVAPIIGIVGAVTGFYFGASGTSGSGNRG